MLSALTKKPELRRQTRRRMFMMKLAWPAVLLEKVTARERAPTVTAKVPRVMRKRATLEGSLSSPIMG